MEGLEDVPDSTDWLGTKLSSISALEGELRCQVCKDFFNTPMITNCSHTFCALCIRRCLSAEGKCPACRSQEQEVRLRRNDTVASLVDIFQKARPSILKVARESSFQGPAETGRRKRKAVELEENAEPDNVQEDISYRTRSRKATTTHGNFQRHDEDDSDAVESEGEEEAGTVRCPICRQKMKEELVYSHLDHCGKEKGPSPSLPLFSPSKPKSSEPRWMDTASRQMPVERLPRLNFSLMKETALRKKLSEVGISSTGSKIAMMKRYDEWVNLVNSNADSLKPQSSRQLLNRLKSWERNQNAPTNGVSKHKDGELIMDKAFDHQAWSNKHKSDFEDLIGKARSAAKSKKPSPTADNQNPEPTENGHGKDHNQGPPPASVVDNAVSAIVMTSDSEMPLDEG